MKKNTRESNPKHPRIAAVEVTDDTLTGRAGLALFARYLDGIGLFWFVARWLGPLRKNAKGQSAVECLRQVLVFLVDGTSRRLAYFDALKADDGYAATIEREPEDLLSSHSVKRFFGSFTWGRIWLLRQLLQELFIWRLRLAEPKVVILDLDVMVMDNDDAEKREGVEPTYKKVKGFAPLQMVWGRIIVDAVLRAGRHHSNHKDTTEKMVANVVAKIRRRHSAAVPIIVRMDSGYFDQKLFELFERLGVGYLSGGKLYKEVKKAAGSFGFENWQTYVNKGQEWKYVEFGDRRGSWDRFRRVIFCRPTYEDRQMLLEFARPDTVIYTNLGMGGPLDDALRAAGAGSLLEPAGVIECYHGRGFDELVHRAFKEFTSERLPFKGFRQNTAYYYTTLLAFALFEAFKADVTAPVVPETAYANTLRRSFLDIAGKIVRHSGRIVLKVTGATLERLKLDDLWRRCTSPPLIPQLA
ncbi:MAG: IS1380 family transposase [Acidimicrobiia bacterium]